jgi:hypothetical protein
MPFAWPGQVHESFNLKLKPVESLIGKPVRLEDMTGPFPVEKMIHDKGQFAG